MMSFSKLSLFSSWSAVALARASVHKQIKDLIKSNSSLLQYPTQFTQDIVPKQIHSHNDCVLLFLPLFRYRTDGKARLEGCAPLHCPELLGWQHRS